MRRIVADLAQRLEMVVHPNVRDVVIALYCLHPLHTQALTHVVQRGIVLSSLGGLVATILLLKVDFDWRKTGWKLALLAWILALLSKPNIAFLPIFWVGLAFYLKVPRKNIISLLFFFLMLLLPVANYFIGGFNPQIETPTDTALNYFLLQGKVILIYAKLIILPIGLRFNHDMLPALKPHWWPGLALWVFYLASIALLFRFVRNKIIGVFFAGALLAFLPESSLFPIMHPIFEHRTFFPMAFMATGLIFAVGKNGLKSWHWCVVGLLVFTSITLAYLRNSQTQRFSHWAQRELGQSCNLGFMQLSLLYRLLEGNHINEARTGLEELKSCSTTPRLLPCLEGLYHFTQLANIKEEDLLRLKLCFHSDAGWVQPSRVLINNLVVDKIERSAPKKLAPCLVEDFYSAQLRHFRKYSSSYPNELRFYALSAQFCLQSLSGDTRPEAKFNKLKIRTIQHHYFGIIDNTLRGDLNTAPATPEYDYLRSLVN
jgi:hypothetical protein